MGEWGNGRVGECGSIEVMSYEGEVSKPLLVITVANHFPALPFSHSPILLLPHSPTPPLSHSPILPYPDFLPFPKVPLSPDVARY
jgi:hypothetical protein